MKDVICLGDALIDFFAVESGIKFKEVNEFRKIPGGTVANVAVGSSKLGLNTAFIGRLGHDEFGYFLRDIFKDNDVDISQIQYDHNCRTGLAFVSVPSPIEREFVFYRNPSADMMLDPDRLNKSFLENTKIFHFGPLSLNAEPSRSATYKAIEIVKNKKNILITYDPSLRLGLWKSKREARKELSKPIEYVNVIKVNDDELYFLTQEGKIEKGINKILSMGPQLCIVTLGEKGCIYGTNNYRGNLDTFMVNTIDSTGCGDSFVAGLLKGLIEENLEELIKNEDKLIKILKYASAAASITSTRKGVIPSLPFKKEVDDFILKYT